jgi:hypothetical protein
LEEAQLTPALVGGWKVTHSWPPIFFYVRQKVLKMASVVQIFSATFPRIKSWSEALDNTSPTRSGNLLYYSGGI